MARQCRDALWAAMGLSFLPARNLEAARHPDRRDVLARLRRDRQHPAAASGHDGWHMEMNVGGSPDFMEWRSMSKAATAPLRMLFLLSDLASQGVYPDPKLGCPWHLSLAINLYKRANWPEDNLRVSQHCSMLS